MSTFTIRVTSSATNVAGTNYGQQPDLGAPSFLDMVVTNSTDPLISNGVYDAYCLNPFIDILLSPTTYSAQNYAGNTSASFVPIGFSSLTQAQVDQLNWLLAQNFTSDAKYGGQFNYGEVQIAIWKTVGFTDAQIASAGLDRFLNDNNRNVVTPADANFLISSAQSAVASGNGVLPTDAFFTTIIDPAGNVQPLIVQLQSAKLGDYVWLDSNADGIQGTGETGVDQVIVELWSNGVKIASTVTGDDYSTAAVEHGYYQFTGLKAGDYQVKFIAPTGQLLTTQDAIGNSQDAVDSDANPATGFSQIVTLAAGESNQTVDAGLLPPVVTASLGDRLWMDTNGNGQQDDGATGISGQTVTLIGGGTDGLISTTGDNTTATTTTGADGFYQFTGLTPGVEYQVQFSKPAGTVFTTQNSGSDLTDSDADLTTGKTQVVTLASGENNPTLDAGVYTPASIGDRVWEDKNANGKQDDGEIGIGGVTVNLRDCVTHAVLATTTTDINGIYSFSGLKPGQYDVVFETPAGYVQTTANAGGDDAIDSDAGAGGITGCYTLNSGDHNTTVDAGMYKTASLGDRLWMDTNGNGQQDDGATGISGQTVTLIGGGTDGLISTTGDNTTATTTTGADGFYQFTGLTPGVEYQVQFSKPAGTVFTTQNSGSDLTDSDADLTTGKTQIVTLASGENNTTLDAGVYTPAKVGIDVEKYVSGTKCTTVQNGCGEGASVSYWKSNCVFVSSLNSYGWTNTGCKSTDTFNSVFGVNCTGGTKTLQQVLSSTGTTSQEVMMRESVAAYLNACHTKVDYAYSKDEVCAEVKYTVSSGDYDRTCKSFNYENNQGCNWTSSKTTWNCTVDNVLYDADSKPGLEVMTGSTVTFTYIVKNTGDNALKNVTLVDDRITSVTYVSGDTNGNKLLDTNETWTYKATEIAQAGTIKNIGTVTAVDAVGGVTQVTDADPAYYTGSGLANKASLGDRVWLDTNANGIQETGEAGIAGVTMKLTGAGADGLFGTKDDITATTSTNASGYYQFTGLNAGKYQVNAVAPSGYFITKQDQGASDAQDSDFNSSGASQIVTLGAGEQNLTVDAGLYKKACIGDRVWEDKNHNNIQDVGEAGIGGVKVSLQNASGATIATTTTNTSGNYSFANLDPGSYRLVFDKTNTVYNGIAMTKWFWAAKDIGSNDAIDADAYSTTHVATTAYTTLTSGQNDMTWDAAITPIVLDLNGDGIHTIARENSLGSFDLLGNGQPIQSGWLSGNDGFLAVDRNGNGRIDDISELFGGSAKGAGFAKLAAYDSNGDGVVNADDAGFADLRIWRDANGNHQTDAGELMTLTQAGLSSLKVSYSELPFLDANDNLHLERSSATLADGTSVNMTDVYFNVSAADAAAAGIKLPSLADLMSGSSSLDGLLAGSTSPAAPVVSMPGSSGMDFDTSALDAMKQLAHLYDQAAVHA